ncbi:MAG: hypothetical protein MJ204_00075 [Bacteroidales bacterium]|nr:hypothetical protein [Bacteroidales bacterium]
MKRFIFFVFSVLFYLGVCSQVPGRWVEHFYYGDITQLETIDDNVFALCDNGIFVYTISTKEITKITKLTGLSSIGLTCMAYCDSTSSFLVGYEDGSLDIVAYPSLKITNISTIQKKNMYGSKAINAIAMRNDTAMIATDFGVVLFSMTTRNFISTTILSTDGGYVAVNDIASNGNEMYAATNKGLYYVENTCPSFSDFGLWHKKDEITHDTIEHIALVKNRLYYVSRDSLFSVTGSIVAPFKVQCENINSIRVRNSIVCLASSYVAKMYDENEKLIFSFDSLSSNNKFYDVLRSEDGSTWVANNRGGLINADTRQSILPDGTRSNHIRALCSDGAFLHIVGGRELKWEMAYYSLKTRNGDWYGHDNWHIVNATSIYKIPHTKNYYIGSYASGFSESTEAWKTEKVFNKDNTILQPYYLNEDWTVVNDMSSDSKMTLWLINASADKPLVARTKDNDWYSYAIPRESTLTSTNLFNHILVDKRGYKWLSGTSLLSVFYENGTLDDTSDDLLTQIELKDSEGNIAEKTTCVTEDLNGQIWIGTSSGIAVHSSPARVFNDRKSISRIKIEIDGEVGYLLSSESITCITVDGANRKWVGTYNSGVYLISENGTEQLLHFTEKNSPLPSNKVNAIAIDGVTGEVAIGTERGLITYWGDATTGEPEMESVKVIPNPVRETYNGNIFIKGLVTDAYVKITDITGNLVNHLQANGGTAVWDGTNLYGKRAKTGVYLVYASDESGKYTRVTKIVFIN